MTALPITEHNAILIAGDSLRNSNTPTASSPFRAVQSLCPVIGRARSGTQSPPALSLPHSRSVPKTESEGEGTKPRDRIRKRIKPRGPERRLRRPQQHPAASRADILAAARGVPLPEGPGIAGQARRGHKWGRLCREEDSAGQGPPGVRSRRRDPGPPRRGSDPRGRRCPARRAPTPGRVSPPFAALR